MKFKIFVAALLAAAAGFYLYDPDPAALRELVDSLQGKSAPAKASKAKVKKAKAPKAAPAPSAPAEDPTPQPAEQAASPAPAAEPAPAAAAQENPPAAPEAGGTPQIAAAGSARVADVLAKLPLVKEATPATEARYYIYLQSAGWCGPCNAEMPNIVKAYEGMKESGLVELILVDFDETTEGAQAYMAKYGATFPAIMKDHAPALPGIQPPSGIPFAIIVDEMGNMVTSGYGGIAVEWKKHIEAYEQKNGLESSFDAESDAAAPTDAAADDSSKKTKAQDKRADKFAVAKALRKVKWMEGKPNRRAKYYIYYQSAGWCGPCCQLMPTILEEYKAMKKDGRVELLHISCEGNADAAKKYHKSNKASFPMVLIEKEGVDKLPGWTAAPTIPSAVIVDGSGQVIKAGGGDIVRQWRQLTIDKEDAASAQK